MKRILSFLLLTALLLSFTACAGNADKDPNTTNEPTAEPEVTTEPATEPATEAPTTEAATTEEPTTEEPEQDKFVYKHVIIVGIDGMGAYHNDEGASTPYLDAIFKDYALTDVALTYNPVASGPCWFSMFTGVSPQVMKTTVNPGEPSINRKYVAAAEKFPTLFTLVHETYPDAAIASISRWDELQGLICSQDYVYKAGSPIQWTTEEEKNNALDYIETMDPNKTNFAYFYFEEPDATGHKKTWGSKEFHEKLTECDAALGAIFNAIEAKGMLDDTLFIVATDHGGEGTQHGHVYTPAALNITLGFRGKTINNIKDFDMIFRDIAPIVVEAMGLKPSSKWAGLAEPPVVPEGLFKE